MEFRTEQDSLGDINVPQDALYSAQTQRAIDNFTFSSLRLPPRFIQCLARIKSAAAKANVELGLLDHEVGDAIAEAAKLITNGEYLDQFPVDVFQTGSGTSTHMNMNEVLASLASRFLAKEVDAHNEVNIGQSSNDVFPTAIHVSSALAMNEMLFPAIKQLQGALESKKQSVGQVIKNGRTHLMDAMPISFAQELSGWHSQLALSAERLVDCQKRLCFVAQGGTAVGTGINADKEFASLFCTILSEDTGINFAPATNYFSAISTQDTAVELSSQLKCLAVSLMKIANDLRWMNSGPLSGIAEINLKAIQPGSSIMPGKVNPVIPEAVTMACAQVIGLDTATTVAGQSGNFQLNVMLPIIAYNLLHSIELLSNSCMSLAKTVEDFSVNHDKVDANLARNPILITALNPIIGYSKAAKIAQRAYEEQRPIIDVAKEMTELSQQQLEKMLDPNQLI
ncbi:class II fumarate hydratase [Thalassotalea ganghwensis]